MPARLFLILSLAGAALAQTPAQTSAPPSAAIFSQVDEILRTLSEITGWKVQRTVPSEILSRDDFRKMLEEGVQDAETNKETHAAEVALKMFGLVPQDFDLARESGDLLAEQAAAFYDYKKKRLFVLDSTKTVTSRSSPWPMSWLTPWPTSSTRSGNSLRTPMATSRPPPARR